jgi:two-component system, NarL family, response regulator DesR
MIDVLLAVHHPVLAMGVQALLQLEADIRVIATADTKQKTLPLVEELLPHVVIWELDDIDLSVSLDVELLTSLTTTNPQVAIVVVTNFPLSYYDNHLFQVGAADYVQKEELSARITDTVKAIAATGQS